MSQTPPHPPEEPTSWTLIRGAAQATPSDRAEFCRLYEPIVRAFLATRWKLHSDDEAVVDAAQEVFVQCFKDNGALQGADPRHPGGFRAYLYGVVKNVALMAERRRALRRARRDGSIPLDQLESDEATLSQAYDRAWALLVTREAGLRMIGRAGAKKDGATRARVLEMRYQQDLPPREIARALGLDVDRVYLLLRHSRREFRAALLGVVSEYHPAATEAELERRCRELVELL